MTLEDIDNMKRDFQNYEYMGKRFKLMDMARKYNCIKGTIRKHFRCWKEDPSMRKIVQKIRRGRVDPKGKETGTLAHRLSNMNGKTLSRFKIIRDILRENPFYTQRQLGLQLRQIEKRPSGDENSYIKRVLQMCGFYRKKHYSVGPQRNLQEKVDARKKYCERYQHYKNLGYHIYHINIEEELFYPHMYRDFFWVHKEDPADLRMLPYAKNVVGAICLMGSNGHFDFQLKNHGYSYTDEQTTKQDNSQQFVITISSLIEKIKQSTEPTVVIASTEKDEVLQKKSMTILSELCKRRGFKLDQIPEDSHQLSPIWAVLKETKNLMKKEDTSSNEGIMKGVVKLLTSRVTEEKTLKTYEDMNYYINRGLEREIF